MTAYPNGPESGAQKGSDLWRDDSSSLPSAWLDESPRPQSVEEAMAGRSEPEAPGWRSDLAAILEAERNGGAEEPPSTVPASHGASVPTALASEWPTLLRVLLARLRGEQPFECCFLCLTSDDPKDCCAEHHDRLETIMHYGEAA